jgi:hypothetical protein
MKVIELFYFSLCILSTTGFISNTVFTVQYGNIVVSNQKLRAKMPSYQEQQEIASRVQKYVQMREIQKLKERGASSEDVANAVRNGTFVGKAGSLMNKKGYQKFLGKGSLDQRLRAVVQYKRSSIATSVENGEQEMSPSEQRELDQMMDREDDDDDDEGINVYDNILIYTHIYILDICI